MLSVSPMHPDPDAAMSADPQDAPLATRLYPQDPTGHDAAHGASYSANQRANHGTNNGTHHATHHGTHHGASGNDALGSLDEPNLHEVTLAHGDHDHPRISHAREVPLAPLRDYESNACFFRAFASPIRIAIVHYLSAQPRTVSEIAAHFDLLQPHVSQHLKVLREARVLATTKVGRHTVYSIEDDHVCIMLGMALAHSIEQPHDHEHTEDT